MENLVFLKLKNLSPAYYYKNEPEIDFIVKSSVKKIETVIEVRFKSNLEEKELAFWKKSSFKEKFLVQNYDNIKRLD